MILRFPLPVRSVVTVCLYQSVEGSLQVLKIHRSILRSRQRKVTRTVTAGGPQGRGVLGPRLRQIWFRSQCSGGIKERKSEVVVCRNEQPFGIGEIGTRIVPKRAV